MRFQSNLRLRLLANPVMDLRTLLHKLHKEVSCSLCMSPFTDPKILPCFHTFCLHCLNERQQASSGIHGGITCPECRTKFQVPGSGYPKELPANFQMNSLADVIKAIPECKAAGECGNCEKNSHQSFYCFQCCTFWCNDCIAAHNIIRATKDHRVLAVKDFQDHDIEDVKEKALQKRNTSRRYQPVLSFGQKGSSPGMLDDPWGVAVNEHNQIAVTDNNNHRIQLFSSNGTYLKCFGNKGVKEGEFDSPSGITYLNNGNIVVADSSNNRLQIFTGQGEYLSQITGEGTDLDQQFDFPWGVSADGEGNIIVADSNNHLIKIFSQSGQFLKKFGKDLLVDPCHCIQKDQYLIVSDYGDHSIKVFNAEGNFLYKFGEEGDENGELYEPRHLSIDKNGNLIVCDCGNDRVQIFKLSGMFLSEFGKRGSTVGDFNGPASTAFLTDGKIVVSDHRNHRIQIFAD